MTLQNTDSKIMDVERLAQTHPMEWQAWQALTMSLPPVDETLLEISTAPVSTLRLMQFPNAMRILQQENDAWVLAYERYLAKLCKASRKAGTPQNGVFYTPAPIARYLVSRTLGQTLSRFQQGIENAISSNNESEAIQYLQKAQALRLVDPACGTGVFLLEILRVLTTFYQTIQPLLPDACPTSPARYALQHQVYGIDIDPVAVAIAEARLMQWVKGVDDISDTRKERNRSFSLSENLRIGNALSPDTLHCPTDKGWDIVLGNPPYISQVRKQAERFQDYRNAANYHSAKMDMCDAFLDWAIRHVAATGQLAYVLPEYWMQRTSTAALRETLWAQGTLEEVWTFPDAALFADAPGHHSALLIWQKAPKGNKSTQHAIQTVACSVGNTDGVLNANVLQTKAFWLHPTSQKVVFGDPVEIALLERLTQAPPLLSPSDIQQGIVLPQGRLRDRDCACLASTLPFRETGLDISGVFLLTPEELEKLALQMAEQACLKPFYLPARLRSFEGFSSGVPDFQLIYGDLETRRRMEKDPQSYARLRAHLDRFSSVNTSAFAPYGLHRARQAEWFESPQKILGLRQVAHPCFALVPHPAYVNESFYLIRPTQRPSQGQSPVDLHYWVALLNSQVAWFWFYKQKRKGHRLQIDKDVLSTLPSPVRVSDCLKAEISELSEAMASSAVTENTTRYRQLKQQLDHCVATAYGLTSLEMAALDAWQNTLPRE